MRPAAVTTRDPLNLNAMPPTQGMELDYRTELYSDSVKWSPLIVSFIGWTLLGLLAAIALRATAVITATTLFLAASLMLGATVALKRFLFGESRENVLKALLFGPFIWFASTVTTASPLLLVYVVPLIATVWLAHVIADHFGCWALANPYLPSDVRNRWRDVWRRQHSSGPSKPWQPASFREHVEALIDPPPREPVPPDDRVRAAETRERHHYPLSFGVLFVAYLFAVLTSFAVPETFYSGMVAILLFLGLTFAWGVHNLRRYAPDLNLSFAARATWQAILCWFYYNDQETDAPGVFQSPFGFAHQRRGLVRVVMFLTAATILPAASYFPMGVVAFGTAPWASTVAQAQGLVRRLAPAPTQATEPPPVVDPAYLAQLPAGSRQAYNEALAALRTGEQFTEDTYTAILASPEGLIVASVAAAVTGESRAVFSLLLSFLACLAVPPLLLFSLVFASNGRRIAHYWLTLEGDDEFRARYHPRRKSSLWEAYTRRLRSSNHRTFDAQSRTVRESDHLLVGFSDIADYPVLLHKNILTGHAHITGDTGSGKSALGLAPLLAQLIDRPHTSILVLDLKGDITLFEAARLGAENAAGPGIRPPTFRWFTNQVHNSTFLFNPFEQRYMQDLTTHQKTEFLLQTLGLDYGEGYGAHYYSSVHRDVLHRVLNHRLNLNSFSELREFFDVDLRRPNREATRLGIDKKKREDASHLFSVVNSLASFEALNLGPRNDLPPGVLENRIDMSEVVEEPHVVYFYLPAALEQTSVREIAKLALHSLLSAAVRRGGSDHQVYVFIDEFQQVVSENLEIVLRQARSMGISLILANQTLSDLKTRAADLIPTVQANTRYKQIFAATDLLQQDAVIKASGEAIYELAQWSESSNEMGTSFTEGAREVLGPRVMRNEIIGATDDELTSIAHVTRGSGYTQYGGFLFPMRVGYHITENEYRERNKATWPKADERRGAFVPGHDRPTAPAATPTPVARPAEPNEPSAIERALDTW